MSDAKNFNITDSNTSTQKNKTKTEKRGQRRTNTSKQKIIQLSELQGNCAYFVFSDYYVIELSRKNLKFQQENKIYENIERMLKIALLFFDKIIIHISDPMRDKNVLNILRDFEDFIKDGIIVFLYSSSIRQIDIGDIIKYAENKHKAKEQGLKYFIDDNEFAIKVVDLFKLSSIIIHRGYEDTSEKEFKKLIKKDSEKIIDENNFRSSKTLYQIINSNDEPSITHQNAEAFIEKIASLTGGDKYSRQHVIDDFIKITGVPDSSKLYESIEKRLCLIYACLNAKNHFIINFLNDKEQYHQLFAVDTVEAYFDTITMPKDKKEKKRKGKRIQSIGDISIQIIRNIRKSSDWKRFIADYILYYTQWKSRRKSKMIDSDFNDFLKENNVNNYQYLLDILMEDSNV